MAFPNNAGQSTEESNAEVIELGIDDLFKDPEDSQPPQEPSTKPADKKPTEPSEMTKNMTARINEVRAKTEQEVQDRVAKLAGFSDYASMVKAQEKQTIEKHGFREEDVNKLLNDLLEKRLADDPRLKRLSEYEEREKQSYIKSQLAEINKVAGTKFKAAEELPPETIALWSKGIDLDQAYLATAGKQLINRNIEAAKQGTLNHLYSTGSNSGAKVRAMSAQELAFYKSINPYATDKELSEKTFEIE